MGEGSVAGDWFHFVRFFSQVVQQKQISFPSYRTADTWRLKVCPSEQDLYCQRWLSCACGSLPSAAHGWGLVAVIPLQYGQQLAIFFSREDREI